MFMNVHDFSCFFMNFHDFSIDFHDFSIEPVLSKLENLTALVALSKAVWAPMTAMTWQPEDQATYEITTLPEARAFKMFQLIF